MLGLCVERISFQVRLCYRQAFDSWASMINGPFKIFIFWENPSLDSVQNLMIRTIRKKFLSSQNMLVIQWRDSCMHIWIYQGFWMCVMLQIYGIATVPLINSIDDSFYSSSIAAPRRQPGSTVTLLSTVCRQWQTFIPHKIATRLNIAIRLNIGMMYL